MTDYLAVFENSPERALLFSGAYYHLKGLNCPVTAPVELLSEERCDEGLSDIPDPDQALWSIIWLLGGVTQCDEYSTDIRFACAVYREYFFRHPQEYKMKYEDAIRFGHTADLLKIGCAIEDKKERAYYNMWDIPQIKAFLGLDR